MITGAGWSYVLGLVGVVGLYLAGRRNAWGWLLGLGTQGLWLTYAITTHQWGFIAGSLAYAWVYARNFQRWRRDERIEAAMRRHPAGKRTGQEK